MPIFLKCGTRECCASGLHVTLPSTDGGESVYSGEALLSVICWCQLTIRGSAVRWSKAKRSGRSPLHTLFHRTALFTHTGHSRWGDTCHSCTVRSEGRPRQAATCWIFTKDATADAVESVIFCNTELKVWNAKLLDSLKHWCHLDFAISFLFYI